MKLFIDSADPEQIRPLWRWGVFDGITTTPTFLRRLNVDDGRRALAALAAEFPGELHVEALGQSAEQILAAARANRELGPNVVSKIPIGPEALTALCALRGEGIAANVHLVFTVNQAMLAAKAGAAYVCPLMGRMQDAGLPADEVVADIVEALGNHPTLEAEVMVSSVRSPESAHRAFLSGAQAVTLPPRVAQQLLASPLTDRAVDLLFEDSARCCLVAERMRGSESVAVVAPETPLGEALMAMTVKGFGIAAVVAEARLVGVITDGDLRRALTRDAQGPAAAVQSAMSRDPKRVRPEDPAERAVALMREHRISELLVVGDADELLGLLSMHDLMLARPAGGPTR